MNPYLEKQLPLLGDLHKKLGLNQQDLDTDLEAINDAIKRAIDEAIGRRKETVHALEVEVEGSRTEIRALKRLLDSEEGEEPRDAVPIVSVAVSLSQANSEEKAHRPFQYCWGSSGLRETCLNRLVPSLSARTLTIHDNRCSAFYRIRPMKTGSQPLRVSYIVASESSLVLTMFISPIRPQWPTFQTAGYSRPRLPLATRYFA